MKKTRFDRLNNFFGTQSQPVSEHPVSTHPGYDSEKAIRESISHGAFGPAATTVCISHTDLDYLSQYCGREISHLEERLSTAQTKDQKLAAYKQFVASVKSHGLILNDKGTFLQRTEQNHNLVL